MNHKPATHLIAQLFTVCIVSLLPYITQAQGIKGKIVDLDGEPLPFASVGVLGTSMGTTANVEGVFQLALAPGNYRIRFQYLGFSHLDTTFQVGSSYVQYKAVMMPEAVALPEAIVTSGGEDPAYTIMRRAIAKAKYHSMQVDEYNAMVYVKGSGRLLKTPWLLRKKINKALAEEGIDSTVAFTQESVSKLHYTRPDQYRDTVISVRTVGDDNNTSPMGFIYSSFYEPEVVAGISPLAPDAFVHYRFEYLGYIEEGDQIVNKIKVTPRAKGDHVFEGVIYIVDNVWSIHSLDLSTYIWGIRFDMQQRFEPLMPGVWLPVHEIYDVSGSVFGFAFEYRYFAQLSDYKITLNPDLEVPVLVLDAKKEKEEAKEAEEKWSKQSFSEGLSALESGEELSTKQLRKMLREYEQQEIEALPEVDTVDIGSTSQQVVDSTAYKRDSMYWATVRPMPLTEYEVRGYVRQDSIARIPPELRKDNDEDDSQDTLTLSMSDEGFAANIKRRSKFQLSHLITGGRYELGEKTYLKLRSPLQSINYNTVDGFHAGYEIEIGNAGKKKINWAAGPLVRYGFSREAVNYEGKFRLYGKGWDIRLAGGEMPAQFNYDFPLSPWANSFYTLFANRNYLKEYEQQFYRATYDQDISPAVGFSLSGEYAERHRLVNTTDIVFFDSKKLLYSSNDPDHVEAIAGDLGDHKAIVTEFSTWIKPFWKYSFYRGTKKKVYNQSPVLSLRYRKGWNAEYDPFDLVSGVFEYKVQVGAGSLWSMKLAAGKFIGDDRPKYFADFAHFPGNRMIGTTINPVHAFRMLDYYQYSTNDEYAYALFNYQFRRFALTQFDYFRRKGIRENVILNALFTPNSKQYAEVGYALNYVFRFMRFEFMTSWQKENNAYKYQDFAFRIGVATDFKSLFGGF